jgi:hypothetical protein
MPVRGERQDRDGVKRTSSGANMRTLPSARRSEPPAQKAPPALSRIRKAINAPPSARLIPVQSQPEASGAIYVLDHS